MSTFIPSHLSVHEINQHKLDIEYRHWISRLSFFEEELDFYGRLLTSDIFRNTDSATAVLVQIPTMKVANKDILEKIHSYKNNLEAYRECDDLECDNFYLNDHENFRVILEKHSAKIREFKSRVFSTVDPGL